MRFNDSACEVFGFGFGRGCLWRRDWGFRFFALLPLLLWVVMALTLASSGALDFVGLGTAASVFSSIGEWFFASMTMPASAYLSIGAIGGGVFLAVTIGFSWKSFCSSSSDG